MVQLALPANSKVENGRVWNRREAAHWRELRIYRWIPGEHRNPRLDTYFIDPERCGPMVLDALHLIRNEIDPTLAFRRSCREGICGSCAMNIDGENRLACLSPLEVERTRPSAIYPLPHMRIIRDLIPDLSRFFDQYRRMGPHLETSRQGVQKEHLQSPADRHKLDGLYECILCACCSSACPSYWWNEETFPGPAALLQANRWIQDSRDEAQDERLEAAATHQGVFGCRQILNCARACPKGLNPAQAIAELRWLLMARQGKA